MKARNRINWTMGALTILLVIAMAHMTVADKDDNADKSVEPLGFEFTPEQMKSRFIKDFHEWVKVDEGKLPKPDAVLAIGSSSMKLWRTIAKDLEPAEIIHRGFGGSRMADVVLMQNFFERYGCKQILIYQGDNDLHGENKEVYRDFIAYLNSFIASVRGKHPDTEFYLISIKFSPSRMGSVSNYAKANEEMRKMAEGDGKIHFIDVNTAMLDKDGMPREDLFGNDRLHLNMHGYAVWKKTVRPVLLGR